jgi:hypothetical protein
VYAAVIAPPVFVIVKTEFPARSHVPVMPMLGGTGVGVNVRVGVGVGVTQTADADAITTADGVVPSLTSTLRVP